MITLDPHQRAAVKWLHEHGGRGLLHMDAGTGKTYASLQYLEESVAKNILIFCPSILKKQWAEEIKKFTGDDALVIEGTKDQRRKLWATPSRFKVVNYELLTHDEKEIIKLDPDAVVADESHMLKSPTSKRYKRFRKLRPFIRIAMSGTPVPNALHEAWTTIDWISPGCLHKNFWTFKQFECYLHPEIRGLILGYRDKAKIQRVIERHSIRITRDVLNLPERKQTIIWVDITPAERKLYDQIKKEARLVVAGEERFTVPNILVEIGKLRQLLDDPESLGVTGDCSKRDVLGDVLSSGGKTIIFGGFKHCIRRLARRHKGVSIYGGQPARERDRALRVFKTEPDIRLLFSTSAGQYGLNLQEARRVIHYGVPWNWARIDQRTSRAHRRGQEQEVEEVFILARDTIDEKMWAMVNRKRKLGESFTRDDYITLLED